MDELPAPLLSRVTVLRLERPPASALDAIVEGLRLGLARRMRVPDEAVPTLDGLALARLQRDWGPGADLRVLRGQHEAEARKVLASVQRRLPTSGSSDGLGSQG